MNTDDGCSRRLKYSLKWSRSWVFGIQNRLAILQGQWKDLIQNSQVREEKVSYHFRWNMLYNVIHLWKFKWNSRKKIAIQHVTLSTVSSSKNYTNNNSLHILMLHWVGWRCFVISCPEMPFPCLIGTFSTSFQIPGFSARWRPWSEFLRIMDFPSLMVLNWINKFSVDSKH